MKVIYVVKCLDANDYERWLGKRKTQCLDGKSMEQFDAGEGMEYVWDWSMTSDTITNQQKWAAEKLVEKRAIKGLKMWVAKLEVP